MRARFVIVCVVALACQPAMEPKVEPPPPRGQPHILVDDGLRGVEALVLALGGSSGQEVTGSFRIINTGHGALELAQVSTLNGLVRAPGFLDEPTPDFEVGLPREPIASGAWVTVPVVFHARRGGASVSSQLELRFGGGQVIVFSLVGTVLRSDCVEAAEVDFGPARVGERLERVIRLQNPAGGDQFVELGNLVGERDVFRFLEQPSGPLRVPGNGVVEVPVSWAPNSSGEHRATLELSSVRCLPRQVTLRGLAWTLPELDGPRTLDFGRVPPLTRAVSSVSVRNTLTRPVTLRATIEFGRSFRVMPGQNLTIPAAVHDRPGAWRTSSIEVFVEAAPTSHGVERGQLLLRSDDARDWLPVELLVNGGPEQVIVESSTVAFGQVAFFPASENRSVREVVIRNDGPTPLRLDPPTIAATSASADELCVGERDDSRGCLPALPALVAPGELLRLPITLTLLNGDVGRDGRKTWRLSIPSSHAVTALIELDVSAEPVLVPPCVLTVTSEVAGQPAQQLDFGDVRPGLSRTGTVQLCNQGSAANERCLVDSFRLRAAPLATFALNRDSSGLALAPGQCTSVLVRALPSAAGVVTGELEFMTSRPMSSMVRIPARVVGR